MQVIGIDFTSSPSRRKSITALHCTFDGITLLADKLEEWSDFQEFEAALRRPGPWIAGIDFPFGQSRRFIETIGWPVSWSTYVEKVGTMDRAEFRSALLSYKETRAFGDKEHRRETDKQAGSISPQKLYGVPVGLMFFEGAPRLLAAGVTIPHLHKGDPSRIVVEAYPGIVARALIGRRSYKNDTKRKQTGDQRSARIALFHELTERSEHLYGFKIDAPVDLCDELGGDHLDALLCAVQAAWSWSERAERYGAPPSIDPSEGWIADPRLATKDQDFSHQISSSCKTLQQ